MLMLLRFNHNFLLLSLIEYCGYFSLMKIFNHKDVHHIENVLELVINNNFEMISYILNKMYEAYRSKILVGFSGEVKL